MSTRPEGFLDLDKILLHGMSCSISDSQDSYKLIFIQIESSSKFLTSSLGRVVSEQYCSTAYCRKQQAGELHSVWEKLLFKDEL